MKFFGGVGWVFFPRGHCFKAWGRADTGTNSGLFVSRLTVFFKGEFYIFISGRKKEEVFYLTTHSTYFIYGYMASGIW